MLRQKSFIHKTRRGHVVKVVREHYLRDDVYCGSLLCKKCRQESFKLAQPESAHYLILDTNVILHQIDLLDNPALKNVVIPQTVLEEVRHRSRSVHERIRSIIADEERHFFVFYNELRRETFIERQKGETQNDRNDRAIRVATKWYSSHLLGTVTTVLLTNDAECLGKARADGVECHTVHAYVKGLSDQYPELVDILVTPDEDEEQGDKRKRKQFYPEYKSDGEIAEGLKSGKYHQGIFYVNRSNLMEGYVSVEGYDEDILIQGREHINRVITGDTVVIEILPKEEWKTPSKLIVQSTTAKSATDTTAKSNDAAGADASAPEVFQDQGEEPRPSGRVVGVIKRNWRPYCGSIESAPRGEYMLFIASDRAIPKIRIKSRQIEHLKDKRIVVVIDKWDAHSLYPSGHYVKELGKVGDKATETEALLIQHDVPFHPFSQNVVACLPHANWRLTEDELKKRLDLRKLNIVSIDPPGCTDIDDALHVQVMPNGNYQVGVHIADVTHFVKPNTAIDDEAAARSTTVYLCDRRIDMLPPLLGTNLCSLMPHVERLAFSVIWEMTPEANIVDTLFTKSVIHSKAAFTYAEAQNRIDNLRMNDPLSQSVRILNSLAKILKQKRMQAGALTLASPEVRFAKSQETQDPIDMELYETKESNSLVEEFMLLANCSVAAKIYSSFPNFAMLRRHPPPPEKNFVSLKKSAHLLNIELDTSSSKGLAQSLDSAVSNAEDPYLDKLIRILTTRCMSQAVYFSSGSHPYNEFHHYGLAAPIYTHFTSPIRRYADVIVHRELAACLGIEPLPMNYNKEYVRRLCNTINHRHRMAQQASRASTELYTVIFFKGKVVREYAYIIRVKANAFICIVPRYGIEGIVYVADKRGNTPFVFDEDQQSLAMGNVCLRMFDKITVQISVDMTNPHRPYMKIECVSPPLAELLGTAGTTPVPKDEMEEEGEEEEEGDHKEEVMKQSKKRKSSVQGKKAKKPKK